ncbi:MAG: NUDIX domain-containing protein [Candidatus Paceibacterota bacterium]|jgi:isopentenyldiphosphate isomerase
MEEYFDIVDENNKELGEKKLRSEAHTAGLWHRTVHIYLFNEVGGNIQFLVHLRSKNKDLHPNCWDTRFGGHLKAGENVESTVESELLEEVGLKLDQNNLIKGEIYKMDNYPNREFTYTFYYRFIGEISALKFNDGEVQEIKWMKVSNIMESMTNEPKIWSGGKDGLSQVLNVLKDKLKD